MKARIVTSFLCAILLFCAPPFIHSAQTENDAPLAESVAGNANSAKSDDTASDAASEAKSSGKDEKDKKAKGKDAGAGAMETMSLGMGGAGGGDSAIFGMAGVNISNPTNTGAAVAGINIIVPPGRGGIMPKLALTYNSNGGNGWVGLGWNLDVGRIQRSTKWGLKYDASDYVFTISGSSSELVSRGDWGTNYYGAKIEGAYTKYYKDTSTNSWVATGKDGIKYYYGSASASRQDNANGIFAWHLDKVMDTNGNTMTLSYVKDQGEVYLDRIDYTGKAGGLGPTNYVKFYTETRTDAPPMYTTKALVVTGKRLKTIEVRGNNLPARAYELQYAQSAGTSRSLLSSVKQYGANALVNQGTGAITGGSSLPAVNIAWRGGGVGFQAAEDWGAGSNGGERLADLNGDGRADMYHLFNFNAWGRLATGSGFTDWQNWGGWIGWVGDVRFGHLYSDKLGDLNGDGRTDIVSFHDTINQNAKVRLGLAAGGLSDWQDWGGTGHADTDQLADLNGDGKADLVRFAVDNAAVRFSTGTGFMTWQAWGTSGHTTDDKLADLDGDGKLDVVQFTADGKANVRLYTDSGFTAWQTWGASGHVTSDKFADLNGDGKADIVQFSNGVAKVRLSTGTGFTNWQTWGASGHVTDDRLVDLNGDGKLDVYQVNNGSAKVRLSTGSGFTDWLDWGSGHTALYERFADVNGDGKADVIYPNPYGSTSTTIWKAQPYSDLVTSLTNGLGGTVSVAYAPSSAYVNTMLPFVLQTMSSMTTNDGMGNDSTINYTYSGGLYSYEDRDFRGFNYVKATMPNNTTAESWYHQDAYRSGRPSKVEARNLSGTLLSKTETSWEAVPLGSTGAKFVKATQICTTNYDSETVMSQVNHTYDDNNGNLLTTVLSGTGGGESITNAYQYNTFGDWNWRQTKVTVTGSVRGKVRETTFGNESGTGNQRWRESWKSGGVNPRINMDYDSYGNLFHVYDPLNRTTTTEYEMIAHTYPWRITYPATNGVAHIVENEEYDYRFGKVKKVKDENGNRTIYTYDDFGRIIQVDSPDGGQVKKAYHLDVFPAYVVTKVREWAGGMYAPLPIIAVSAGKGGSVTPGGTVAVYRGSSQTFNIVPDANCQISNVLVDGASVGAVSSYTFSNVTENHTLSVVFSLAPVRIAAVPGVRDVRYFPTIQSAYNAASEGDVIQCRAVNLIENLNVNRNINVSLHGGYNEQFADYTIVRNINVSLHGGYDGEYISYQAGVTHLKGQVRTYPGGGKLNMKNFILEQ